MFLLNNPGDWSGPAPVQLNFLWKADSSAFYVMDNHRAALWCWLRELQPTDPYTLFHIDYHWDTAPMPEEGIERIRTAWPLDVGEFHELCEDVSWGSREVVRWDNYIHPLLTLRPNVRAVHLAAHEGEHHFHPEVREHDQIVAYQPVEFLPQLPDLLSAAEGRKLINVDLDFFFSRGKGRQQWTLRQELAEGLCKSLATVDDLGVVTIAWSPDCAGGWKNAARMCSEICKVFNVDCVAEHVLSRLSRDSLQ